jgi:hypothetical protein
MGYFSYVMISEESLAFEPLRGDDSRRQLLALLDAMGTELTWQQARELFWAAFSGERPAEVRLS